jgi:hypothetical protein
MGMGELDDLGLKYKTDKNSGHHNYLGIYESYLKDYRESKVSLIELGVGGYEHIDRGGESLKMFYDYLHKGRIIGLDIHEKNGLINDRTEFWRGDQTDENLLKAIMHREENADIRIVIDDASHINKLTIRTFKILFPMLKSGDLYFIEDVHTSYWDENYGGSEVPGAKGTAMEFFTRIAHQLNSGTLLPEYRTEFADKLEFIHFYKEIIVVKKL